MKKLWFFALLILAPFLLTAQSKVGGFGHFSVGYGWENWSKLNKDLRISERLGTDLNLSNHGISGGVAGYFVFDRFLIGAKGYGTAFGNHSTPRGEVEMVSGAGFLNFGTMLFANPGGFGYVFGGIGGGGSGVSFTNNSDDDWYFKGKEIDELVDVDANSKDDFGYGGVAGELGLAVDRWVIGKNGGMKLGLETGANFWLYRVEWENGNSSVSDLSHPGDVGFYVRLTIGGGYVSSLQRSLK